MPSVSRARREMTPNGCNSGAEFAVFLTSRKCTISEAGDKPGRSSSSLAADHAVRSRSPPVDWPHIWLAILSADSNAPLVIIVIQYLQRDFVLLRRGLSIIHVFSRSRFGRDVPKLRSHLLNTTLRSRRLHVFGGLARDCPSVIRESDCGGCPHNAHLSIGPPVGFDSMYIPTLGNQTAYLAANERYPTSKPQEATEGPRRLICAWSPEVLLTAD